MSLTMGDDGVEAAKGRSKLRKQLHAAVRNVQWSYIIFWSYSPTQSRALEWGEGCYNGDIKKRKKRYEPHCKYGLQRSKQLRKLYLCMLQGDSGTSASTTHDDDDDDDSTSMMLSPDDLSDEEWYYLVSMSYVFSPSQCLPGRASATGETIWLCNAHYAENKLFSRSLLARSASIQTVVCFPYLSGVIELGVTELISEDHNLLQRIKSCLLENSKPGCSSNHVSNSAHRENDDEKYQIGIKNNQTPLLGVYDLSSDEDLHYKKTVSTVLNYAEVKLRRDEHLQTNLVSSDHGSSFLRWKRCEQPDSNLHQEQRSLKSSSHNVLRKILQDVPLMNSEDTKRKLSFQRFGLNQDDSSSDRRKENEKFSVLRSMVPTVNEVDKESILKNTIKYLQELESRVEELESCLGSVNFVERQRKMSNNLNDSVLIEETSGNYDEDSAKLDDTSRETEQANETHVSVKLTETEVVIEVRCSYRDYIVADIMETLSNLHMDAFSVRSHTLDRFLTLNLKAKLRGAAVASVGMIKRELKRVIGERV